MYGPIERIEVLAEVRQQLAWAEAGCPLWPGDNLLLPINPVASPSSAGLPTAWLGEEFDEFGPA
ncbi:hypothetical protein [Streptomyces xylophagus]|uniref:hypothetical protein n=1 Tax=Streptomyces xylophagus TaxID=285514 RepID=UPI0005B8FD96|nr:hypothetical protein [Streptomyces xylophagus]